MLLRDSWIVRRWTAGLAMTLVAAALLLPAVAWLLAAEATAQDAQAASRAAMVRRIDELLAERWQQADVEPAAAASDDEFLRRVSLDLTGVIPPVAEVRSFRAATAPDKRAQYIDQLLASPGYATQMATVWRNRLLPRGFEPAQLNSAVGLENWLRRQFLDNLRYDNLVADFLVAQGAGTSGPALYYTSLELKPEKLAASSARLFLGIQIQCAECHDHPFDHWTQRDFWGYAAFFAQLEQPVTDGPTMIRVVDRSEGEVRLPDSDEVVAPRFPGAGEPELSELGSRRAQLAIWMASRDNPYLARAAVNMAWAHLFGRGIVHPIDDHGDRNPPSHPQLLDELAQYFVDSGFDLQELFRTLANTEAYQRTSTWNGETPPAELFAVALPKTLTPEQLYDSLQRAAGLPTAEGPTMQAMSNRLGDAQRLDFLLRMQASTRDALDYQAGLPQALVLMNGPLMSAATHPGTSPLLRSIRAPFFTDPERLETLFLATLTRPPTAEEQATFLAHVQHAPEADTAQAWSDIAWALLNSAEFALNH